MLWNQPIIDSRDDAIPEYYAVNLPYIRACATSAKHTSRAAEDKLRISRTSNRDQRRETE